MSALASLWAREPAVVIGVAASIIVLVAQGLVANSLVTSAQGLNWLNFLIGLVPAIAAILTRSQVTPAP